MAASDEDEWEIVHTIDEFYDVPRRGVADFQGMPHAYRPMWDEEADDYSAVYELSPITPAQFKLVMEAWAIWERWASAHFRNQLGPDDAHPALAIDRARYEDLRGQVDRILTIDPKAVQRAIPTFRTRLPSGSTVRWSSLS